MKQILVPFVAGVTQPDNGETRARIQKMLDYIRKNNLCEDDYLVLLSGGGNNKTLARSLYEIIKKLGGSFSDEVFLYEEKSWDTTTQVKEMIPIVKKFSYDTEIVVFSNRLHLARIGLIFARYGIKIKKEASRLSFENPLFYYYYIVVYEPLMFLTTILGLDNLISHLTKNRLKRFNR